MHSPEQVAAIQQSLKDKGVKYCIGAYVDIHGIQKAKVVPIDHLPQMAAGSERYTGYALDGLGRRPEAVPVFEALAQACGIRVVEFMPTALRISRVSPCFAGFDPSKLVGGADLDAASQGGMKRGGKVMKKAKGGRSC